MSLVNFYKIVCNDSGLIYVGSTTWTIERRLKRHEYDYSYYLENKRSFITSFIILEKNNYSIHLIDCVECVDKKQRNILEGFYILNENCINKCQTGRDKKQWYQDNKEQIKEQRKQYRQDNKENIHEYRQKWRVNNKEKLKEQDKQYYQDNKEKRTEKFTCSCGGKYIYMCKARHERTKKHLNYLATL
jgi:adenylate kinase family enzyme